ncbi:NEL-type E3 ubiquitin ligase domain-containing protein [Candidatus Neptunochlamydia vexilliferae]|uniref:Uncharacterized protein n=1 Tax=Candidatus Neptunichlamydia vexilliferae TaxID=1651774 RepID=A0ABS0B0L8_9BACT|nr:NEL-type E3 ubiquitin ligase domain-containing protein [Candidatus Neptunochlamydia vexilliferae]MBF5059110.1 hypothetical protein [Candidatus Neptunochlamydia vexilliferae]
MGAILQFGCQVGMLCLPYLSNRRARTGIYLTAATGTAAIVIPQLSEGESKEIYRIRLVATSILAIAIPILFISYYKGKCLGESKRIVKEVFGRQVAGAIALCILSEALPYDYRFRYFHLFSQSETPNQNQIDMAWLYRTADSAMTSRHPTIISSCLDTLRKSYHPPKEFTQKEKNSLNTFISKLRTEVVGGITKQKLAQLFISYIERAKIDEDFRGFFFTCLSGATGNCNDRRALTIARINPLYELSKIPVTKPREILSFLKKCWTLELVESQIRGLKVGSDENTQFKDNAENLEVMLAHLLAVKEKFNLPLGIEGMYNTNIGGANDATKIQIIQQF